MKQRISAFILSSLLIGLVSLPTKAQEGTAKEAVQAVTDKAAKPALFQGLSLSVEVGTLIARALGGDTFGSEAALRVSIRNKYFPVVELGYGRYDGKNDKTNIQYKTGAPYFRLGADVNMLKNKTQNNRLFLGGRVGFTTYSFDVDGPDIIDPIWHTTQPLHYEGLSSRKLWLEALLGVEAEVFKNFHMGFNLRYKFKLNEKTPVEATPYYVPGFGCGGSSGFTISYYLTFDLSKKIAASSPTTK